MANPLPNEETLYAKIKTEGISINPEIWDLLYQRIGDDVTAINLLCQSYLSNKEPIPIPEAKEILSYTRHIKDIINQITLDSKEGLPFPEFINDIPLHPILREMLTHYFGNDVYMINLIVQDSIDPLEPHAVSLKKTQKILDHTLSIRGFMEKLRQATSQEKSPPPAKEITAAQKPKPAEPKRPLSQEELFFQIRFILAREFSLPEEKIKLSSRFKEDLGLDSVANFQVVMALEQEFSLEIPDEDEDKITTVAYAVEYIFNRLKLSPPTSQAKEA